MLRHSPNEYVALLSAAEHYDREGIVMHQRLQGNLFSTDNGGSIDSDGGERAEAEQIRNLIRGGNSSGPETPNSRIDRELIHRSGVFLGGFGQSCDTVCQTVSSFTLYRSGNDPSQSDHDALRCSSQALWDAAFQDCRGFYAPLYRDLLSFQQQNDDSNNNGDDEHDNDATTRRERQPSEVGIRAISLAAHHEDRGAHQTENGDDDDDDVHADGGSVILHISERYLEFATRRRRAAQIGDGGEIDWWWGGHVSDAGGGGVGIDKQQDKEEIIIQMNATHKSAGIMSTFNCEMGVYWRQHPGNDFPGYYYEYDDDENEDLLTEKEKRRKKGIHHRHSDARGEEERVERRHHAYIRAGGTWYFNYLHDDRSLPSCDQHHPYTRRLCVCVPSASESN